MRVRIAAAVSVLVLLLVGCSMVIGLGDRPNEGAPDAAPAEAGDDGGSNDASEECGCRGYPCDTPRSCGTFCGPNSGCSLYSRQHVSYGFDPTCTKSSELAGDCKRAANAYCVDAGWAGGFTESSYEPVTIVCVSPPTAAESVGAPRVCEEGGLDTFACVSAVDTYCMGRSALGGIGPAAPIDDAGQAHVTCIADPHASFYGPAQFIVRADFAREGGACDVDANLTGAPCTEQAFADCARYINDAGRFCTSGVGPLEVDGSVYSAICICP